MSKSQVPKRVSSLVYVPLPKRVVNVPLPKKNLCRFSCCFDDKESSNEEKRYTFYR